jgi:hypothetical protein
VVAPRRSWRQPVVLWVMGLLALLGFGLGSPAGTTSGFGLSTPGQALQLPSSWCPRRPRLLVLSLLGWPWPGSSPGW